MKDCGAYHTSYCLTGAGSRVIALEWATAWEMVAFIALLSRELELIIE